MSVPRTQFYHPARVIDAALHAIDRSIRRAEGIALVVGPPGTGKSLLLAKVAESVGEDFTVALLSGARICTRRALWQSILAEIGRPYRGIDEADLRISLAEVVRSLAAAGSGLVILVDEAHTLPLRLIEELRLLANTPTPLPAVHIVLAGTTALEERIGSSKMESLAQRIAVRSYLEPLDHAETVAYLRTQTKAAGLDWDACFEAGCDDAVYSLADGVPRLMNQICDQALVLVGNGRRVGPADVAAAWQEIQRLPPSALAGKGAIAERPWGESLDTRDGAAEFGNEGAVDGMIEFGALDDEVAPAGRPMVDVESLFMEGDDPAETDAELSDRARGGRRERGGPDPWSGPDVEFVFDAATDPFQEFFEQEERIVERYLVAGPDDFGVHGHVSSAEGSALVRQLLEYDDLRPATAAVNAEATAGATRPPHPVGESGGAAAGGSTGSGSAGSAPSAGAAVAPEDDDADMVVIEEDLLVQAAERPAVSPVRLGDYRRLFARLRRGG